jgi:aerobic carbon-monoxide dehydrogenase large subunit
MGQFGFGQSVPRTEDPRLLRGEGRFIADFSLPHQAHGHVMRSSHAHARIVSLDVSAARTAPGVIAVFTSADIEADDLGTTHCRFPRKRPDGSPMYQNPHPGLVGDRVRFVGDQIAYVVAETLDQAKDAAELIAVEYQNLPSVAETAAAFEPDAPPVWDDCPDNISNVFELGDEAAVDAAFERAHHVTRQRFVISRIAANAMEPRGCIGEYNIHEGRYTLHGCVGTLHSVRRMLATDVFKVPENRFRVICGDIGGAFGSKGVTSTENILALYAAKKIGRPVRWVGERSETFLSDDHARDNVSDVELALDADGKFLALRVRTLCNLGAYLSSDRTLQATFGNLGSLAGVYTTPAIHVRVHGVFTNTVATATYRGAGRPEATYVLEGIIDRAARETGIDRVELRRRNLIPADAMPYKTALVFEYDSGDFETNMDQALGLADYQGYPARRAESEANGKLRGLGIVNPIERAGAPPGPETAEIRFDPSGSVTLFVATKSQGQGHDTMYKILMSHMLGLDSDDVMVLEGDTDKVAFGTGTYGSRSAVVGGSAVYRTAEKIIKKGRLLAAHLLEAADSDIEFERGIFTVAGTDRSVTLQDVARASYRPGARPKGMEPGLFETGTYEPEGQTFPNGCHVCEIEIDPDTGRMEILSYVVVDDVGNVINELTLEGQVQGGVVQGIGQAVMEHMIYDRQDGQLTSGSFMDYAMPRADDICAIEVHSSPVPTKTNPLGVKGAGEAGTVGALPVIMNAALDALNPLGIHHIEMPLTAEKIWRAIHDARGR